MTTKSHDETVDDSGSSKASATVEKTNDDAKSPRSSSVESREH